MREVAIKRKKKETISKVLYYKKNCNCGWIFHANSKFKRNACGKERRLRNRAIIE